MIMNKSIPHPINLNLKYLPKVLFLCKKIEEFSEKNFVNFLENFLDHIFQ